MLGLLQDLLLLLTLYSVMSAIFVRKQDATILTYFSYCAVGTGTKSTSIFVPRVHCFLMRWPREAIVRVVSGNENFILPSVRWSGVCERPILNTILLNSCVFLMLFPSKSYYFL